MKLVKVKVLSSFILNLLFERVLNIFFNLKSVMKRAVKWTSTVDGLEKCSLVDVDQEKCSGVDVDGQRSTLIRLQWSDRPMMRI